MNRMFLSLAFIVATLCSTTGYADSFAEYIETGVDDVGDSFQIRFTYNTTRQEISSIASASFNDPIGSYSGITHLYFLNNQAPFDNQYLISNNLGYAIQFMVSPHHGRLSPALISGSNIYALTVDPYTTNDWLPYTHVSLYPTVPVPETQQWAMMLFGLPLLAEFIRRTVKNPA